MLIERRTALAEVLPWLWPLADEDSGCKLDVKPNVQIRLLSALIAIPEAMDDALGGKVRHRACRMLPHVRHPEFERRINTSFGQPRNTCANHGNSVICS